MNIKSLTSVLLTTVDSVGMAIPVLASPAVLVGRVTGSINVRPSLLGRLTHLVMV